MTGRSARYCASCRELSRCGFCEKVGGGHLAWCTWSHPAPASVFDKPSGGVTPRDLEWAAGFLEGEGSFAGAKKKAKYAKLAVTTSQVSAEPLGRLQRLFGGRIFFSPGGGKNGIHEWHLYGPAAAGLMMTLFSLMSTRRKEQIKAALSVWRDCGYRTHNRRKTAAGYLAEEYA